MGTTDRNPPHGADTEHHPQAACFGECGMDHRPESPARTAPAAGLFGVFTRRVADTGVSGPPIHRNDDRMLSAA